MNVSNSKPIQHFRWLILLLASLFAGMGCATELFGQVPSNDLGVTSDVAQSDSEVPVEAIFSDDVSHGQLEFSGDQLIITKKPCHGLAPVCVSAQDEVWLVSARGAHCNPCEISELKCCWMQNGNWQNASLSDLTARHTVDKSRSTLIYVHGNRTDLDFAKARGLQVYQSALQDSPCPRPPVRFVVFVWKSEKEIKRPVADFGIKSERAVDVGKTLARLLGQFDDRNLSIVGFSLGTQVILSAITCAQRQGECADLDKYRVALIAPALDPNFVRKRFSCLPNNQLVEQTDVFLNRHDRAIKAAQLIVRRRSRASITSLHELAGSSRPSANPIRIHDITREISKRHSVTSYVSSPTVRAGLAQMLYDAQGAAYLPMESEPALLPPATESVVAPAE